MNPKPGEVWLADLGLSARTRPVVILSRYDSDPPRALVVYAPLTTQNRNSQYEVILPKLNFLEKDSFVNMQGIASLPKVWLERKIGEIPCEIMDRIKKAIIFTLDLEIKA